MSTVSTIIDAIDKQFQANTALSTAVSKFAKWEDEIDLVNETKKFPFINLTCDAFHVEEADNMRFHDMKREKYNIVITFAVKATKKALASTGIWTLHDLIIDAIETDTTFSGAINVIPFKPTSAADVARWQDERFWIGRGAMIFEGHNDVNLR